MLDIRKMLEEQLVKLQDASMNPEATADCTYAMLAIVDVLYPEGIPEAESTSRLVANIKIDAKEFASVVIDHFGKQSSLIASDGSLELKVE